MWKLFLDRFFASLSFPGFLNKWDTWYRKCDATKKKGQCRRHHFFFYCGHFWWCPVMSAKKTILMSLSGNCAHFHKGGWWYNACGQANLNGVWYTGGVYRSKFQDGIFWAEYGGGFYSMKSVRMLIRPIDWSQQLLALPQNNRDFNEALLVYK